MRSQILISALGALSVAAAVPLDVSISYLDRTITQTVTVTAGQANPTEGSSKIALHNWAASGTTSQPPAVTVISQDALPAPVFPEDYNYSVGVPLEETTASLNNPVQIDESGMVYLPVAMPSASPSDLPAPDGAAASAGMVTDQTPGVPTPSTSESIPTSSNIVTAASSLAETMTGGGYTVEPTLIPSDTMSAGSPVATPVAPPSPSGATGCQATGPGTAGQGKAGLGWTVNSGPCANDFLQPGSKVNWGWNWSPFRDRVPAELEFVPTMFDADLESVSEFLNAAWAAGGGSVMTLYEPHLAERGNATAQEAADIHTKYVNSMEGSFQIGGPIMSQDSTGTFDSAKKWYTDFYVACKENCVIDFLPLAVYGTDPVRSIGEITEWYNLFGASLNVPIWLVEYDCRDLAAATTCSPEAASAYARAVTEWAEGTEWVARYAFFDVFVTTSSESGNANSLVNAAGSIIELGQQYAYGFST